jgi:hypothetical protein
MRMMVSVLLLWIVVPSGATLASSLLDQQPGAEQQKQEKIDEFNRNRTRINELRQRLDSDEPMTTAEARNATTEVEALLNRQSQLRLELKELGVASIPETAAPVMTTGGGAAVTSTQPPFAVPAYDVRMLREAAADVEKARQQLQDAAREPDPITRQAATNEATVNLIFTEMKLAHLAAGPTGGGVTEEEARTTEPISKNNAELSEINDELKKIGAEIEKTEGLLSKAQAAAGQAATTGAGAGLHGQLVNRYEHDLKPLVERRAALEQRRVALHQENDKILIGIAKARLVTGTEKINQRLDTENKPGRFTLHQAATNNEQSQAESRFLNWLYTAPGHSFGRPGPAGSRAGSFIEGVDTVPLNSTERNRLGAQAPAVPSAAPATGFALTDRPAASARTVAAPINVLSNPAAFNFAAVRSGGNVITVTQRMIVEPDESILDEIDGVLVIAGNARESVMPASIARSAWSRLARLAPAWGASWAGARHDRTPPASREIWLPPLERGQGGSVVSGIARIAFKSLGTSTGEAFEMTVVNDGPRPIRLDPSALVLEPLRNDVQRRIQQELSKAAGKAATVKMNGYCLEFLKTPPVAGTTYRIAEQAAQQQFAPARKILNATRALQKAGVLKPDSNPVSYFHAIRQWAIWTRERNFDMQSFGAAFLEHTRKTVAGAGRPWTAEADKAIRAAVPGRWSAIAQILQEAERLR